MKRRVAENAVALATLARDGFAPNGDLILTADEEVGDAGAPIVAEARPDLCPDFVVGEGAGEHAAPRGDRGVPPRARPGGAADPDARLRLQRHGAEGLRRRRLRLHPLPARGPDRQPDHEARCRRARPGRRPLVPDRCCDRRRARDRLDRQRPGSCLIGAWARYPRHRVSPSTTSAVATSPIARATAAEKKFSACTFAVTAVTPVPRSHATIADAASRA